MYTTITIGQATLTGIVGTATATYHGRDAYAVTIDTLERGRICLAILWGQRARELAREFNEAI